MAYSLDRAPKTGGIVATLRGLFSGVARKTTDWEIAHSDKPKTSVLGKEIEPGWLMRRRVAGVAGYQFRACTQQEEKAAQEMWAMGHMPPDC
jgi:hypothetical protein